MVVLVNIIFCIRSTTMLSAMDTLQRPWAQQKYTYGKQWDDYVCVDSVLHRARRIYWNKVTYLSNNLVSVWWMPIGVYRSQASVPAGMRPWWTEAGETTCNGLLCQYQLNRMARDKCSLYGGVSWSQVCCYSINGVKRRENMSIVGRTIFGQQLLYR